MSERDWKQTEEAGHGTDGTEYSFGRGVWRKLARLGGGQTRS